jgi:hypothetical protein
VSTASLPAASETERARVLKSFGAAGDDIAELLDYNRNIFEPDPMLENATFPLDDEEFVEPWLEYVQASRSEGVFPTLKKALVHLNFPVREGLSGDAGYRAVVLRGNPAWSCEAATGLELNCPDELRLWLHQTPGGRIPVILTADRSDFEDMLRALTARSEPVVIPESLGAMIVGGYNNWDRIARYRDSWLQSNPGGDWGSEFKQLAARKNEYQDRFIVLSSGPYSGIAAESLGLEEDEWLATSLDIRLNHEGAHYWTRRVCGSMRNNLHDEIIADYAGIVAAVGHYRSHWFLRFLGMENYPEYRAGGRLEHYRGDPPLSESAFKVLQGLVKSAAEQLEVFDRSIFGPRTLALTGAVMMGLTRITLEELAGLDGSERLKHVVPRVEND